jgi:choline dehydrogenase-like flavoprotein
VHLVTQKHFSNTISEDMTTFNITGKGKKQNTYDAIVIGSGITGGLAAKELAEGGLKVIMLERGRMVEHIKDYHFEGKDPWELPLRNLVPDEEARQYEIQRNLYLFTQDSKDFFVRDSDHPYLQEKPFHWFRGYQVGGRSLIWSKHCYRWSEQDFSANQKEGIAIDWPVRYADLAPWYSYVEKYIGVSGNQDGISQIPDGEFLPPFDMNIMDKHLQKRIKEHYAERDLVIGRMAILTKDHNGRKKCHGRNLCHRGCVFGAPYSSNSAAIPDAARTGNLTVRPYSIVESLIWDRKKRKLIGVNVIDSETKETTQFFAKVVFLNASTLGSTQILLQSANADFPDGLANSSGVLGHYLMDHHSGVGAMGGFSGYKDSYYKGERPASVYIPRFVNLHGQEKEYRRGFGFENYTSRQDWTRGFYQRGIGGDWKDQLSKPGDWFVYFEAYGETLPYKDNFVSLDKDKKDKWGLPLLKISMTYRENEMKMREDMKKESLEMLQASGMDWAKPFDNNPPPGCVIHEMGTARMGHDPETSVLNKWNQSHDISNLFVTDGSCMTSSACQNPSLTYMALTARACRYALEELKKGNL